jgi:hypothetical protein
LEELLDSRLELPFVEIDVVCSVEVPADAELVDTRDTMLFLDPERKDAIGNEGIESLGDVGDCGGDDAPLSSRGVLPPKTDSRM